MEIGRPNRAELKLEPRVVLGDHRNEGRLALMYGPLVLAADESLLGVQEPALNAVGVPSADLKALHFTPERAPEKFKTWPNAEVSGSMPSLANLRFAQEGTPMKISLVPFADAGASGSKLQNLAPFQGPRTRQKSARGWRRDQLRTNPVARVCR